MKIAVVGATGLVGRDILKVLEERNIQVTEFFPVASSKSTGKKLLFPERNIASFQLKTLLKRNLILQYFRQEAQHL